MVVRSISPSLEDRKPVAETVEDLSGGHHRGTGSSKLDRQRQASYLPADSDDGVPLYVEIKINTCLIGSLGEEVDRRRMIGVLVHRERSHSLHLLASDAEGFAGRCEHRHIRSGGV